MQHDLYPSPPIWRELQCAVRERAGKKCEHCGAIHNRIRQSKRTGNRYVLYLHTAHKHGVPLQSCNPDDYLALCPRCHMRYDRSGFDGEPTRYRPGYIVTTTDELLQVVGAVGLHVWQDEENNYWWRIGDQEGYEVSPVLAVGAALARLYRFYQEDGEVILHAQVL